jgi:hypothetical protein
MQMSDVQSGELELAESPFTAGSILANISGARSDIILTTTRMVRRASLGTSVAPSAVNLCESALLLWILRRTHHLLTTINDLHVDILLHRYYVAAVFRVRYRCKLLKLIRVNQHRCESFFKSVQPDPGALMNQGGEFLSLVR